MKTMRPGPLTTADRLRKLRAMSPDEVWTRVRYGVYCRAERSRLRNGRPRRPDRLRDALVPSLSRRTEWQRALLEARSTRGTKFFAGVANPEATRQVFAGRFQAERQQVRTEADRVLRGELSFFGRTFHYPTRIDWHADPVSGVQWPQLYHADIPVDGGDIGYGDVKYVWELARHQFLVDLAKAWVLEGDASSAAATRAIVLDWRSRNPAGIGVSWACALEPAFRVLSWLWTYFMTVDDPQLDADDHLRWLEGFHDHGWFLYRHLEYYKSPFNHLIGEACALYALGVLFPQFAEAARWRSHARQVLESRLSGQFYADGGSVEQSTFYHHATTGFYLLAAILGRQNGEEFSDRVWVAIERAIEFSMVMQQPDGSTPRIGGADDGKPIRLEQLPLWDFRPYQAVGAVLFGRGDFRASAQRFYEDALWLLGAEGAARFDAIQPSSPTPASRVLPASGYVVLRDAWGPEASYVCFDCGEQAAGLRSDAIPSAAHGHADCLSIIAWRRGRPVLVDAGFHCYNGPKGWQDHFRETAAHNTLRIDGQDQAVHISKMAWSHTYTATLEGHLLDGTDGWVVGSHDGYQRLDRGALLHRRAVWARRRGYVVVCDFLEGTGQHDVEVTFQFAPGRLRRQANHVCFDEVATLHWFAARELTATVHEGGAAPDEGWIAPSLGVKTAAPRLVLAAPLECPTTIVSILGDRDRVVNVAEVKDSAHRMICIYGSDWTDCLWVKGYADDPARDLDTDGLAAIWRHEHGSFVADGHLGGSFQRP